MPDRIQRYIAATDNANDYVDNQSEELAQRAREDIDDLLMETSERDVELWDAYGVDVEASVDDYELIDTEQRDINWSLGLAGTSAAALNQFFLDNREETIIKPLAYREQVLAGFALTYEQITVAGKRGVELMTVDRFEALQSRYMRALAPYRQMSNLQLYQEMVELGAMRSIDQTITDQMKYVSRMTPYRPGSQQFREAVADLVDINASDNLRSMNRRAAQQMYTMSQLDGDESKLMVWIVEGGDNTCSYCAENAGVVKKYSEWVDDGLPGAEVCKGGDRCRCQLVAAE